MAKLAIKFPTLKPLPEVVCGRGSLRALAEAPEQARTMFMVSGSDRVRSALERMLAKTAPPSEHVLIASKPTGEPTSTSVAAGARRLAEQQPEIVVAIGGGSVLDWARLSAREAGLQCRFWLAPTTCGTGAEAADVAVFTEENRKRAIVDPMLAAERVVLDGALVTGLFEHGIECHVADALSHGIEGYCSLVPNDLAKTFGIAAVRTILDADTTDSKSADALLQASFMAGISAANCSVGIAHAFAHAVGVEGVPHGLGNALALPAAIRLNTGTHNGGGLAAALGYDDALGVCDAVRRITRRAVAHEAATVTGLLAKAENESFVQDVAQRMSSDVAMRTNPKRLNADELVAFIHEVSMEAADWLKNTG